MANKVVAVTLTARTAPYIAQMAAAAKATGAVGTAAARANVAAQPMGRSFRNAARATDILNPKLLGPAGLVYGLKSVVGQAARFEDEFAMVRKTMNATDDVLDQVALNIRDMATDMPVTTTELNRIATVAGQLGIPAEDVSHFTETIAKLSVTTNMTAEQAAIDFARFSNIIGKPIDEVDELGNVIVRLGNNMAAEETEIMEFAKRIAGVGTQMGMTEAEILALSAALPALGLRAEMGGTAITRIMVELNEAVTEGGEKLGIFAEAAGMSAGAFAEAWRSDPSNTLLEFTAGIGEMSDEGADAFATIADLDLSMIRTQDTALRLAGGTEQYTNALALASDEMERQSANQVEWDKRMETTVSQANILKNNIRELALEVGGPLNEALGNTLRILNDIWDGTPEDGVLGAIAQATPSETLFGENRVTGEDRTAFDMFKNALSYTPLAPVLGMVPGGRESGAGFVELLRAEAEAGQKLMAAIEQPFGLADYEADFLELNNQIATTDVVSRSAAEGVGELDEALEAAEESALIAAEGLETYIDWTHRAQDPVFNLISAVEDVAAAEKAYNETLDENGNTTEDSAQAALDHLRALGELERAAINGDLSFADFSRSMDGFVESGRLTATQADLIRLEVMGAREESEEYDGEYVANLIARTETAEERLRRINNLIASIPARIDTQVNIGLGGIDVDPDSPGNQLPIPGGLVPFVHSGGYVLPSGNIQRFHNGGIAGLKPDEVPAVLQTGEMVLSRSQVAEIGSAFSSARESMVRSTPVGTGSSGAGGRVTQFTVPVVLDGREIGRSEVLIDGLTGEVIRRSREFAGSQL